MQDVRAFFSSRRDIIGQLPEVLPLSDSATSQPCSWGSEEYQKLNNLLLDLHRHVDSAKLDDIYNITLPPNVDSIDELTSVNTSVPVFDIMTDANLLECVKDTLGICHISYIDTVPIQQFRMKPPTTMLWSSIPLHASTGTTRWHQDRFSYHPQADNVTVLTCWMPFIDLMPEMGLLTIIPGSHNIGFQTHVPECEEHPDECSIPESVIESLKMRYGFEAAMIHASAGDLVILDPLMIHCSTANTSQRSRVSIDLRYCHAGSISARPWFPSFRISELTAEHYHRAWEEAKQALLTKPVGQLVRKINRFHTASSTTA